jgi:hypothetical protein
MAHQPLSHTDELWGLGPDPLLRVWEQQYEMMQMFAKLCVYY